jgi:hypothetical protein
MYRSCQLYCLHVPLSTVLLACTDLNCTACLYCPLPSCLQHRFINSQSYAKRRSNDRWSVAETNRFYHALACFGTDFTAIAKLFPGRDR